MENGGRGSYVSALLTNYEMPMANAWGRCVADGGAMGNFWREMYDERSPKIFVLSKKIDSIYYSTYVPYTLPYYV